MGVKGNDSDTEAQVTLSNGEVVKTPDYLGVSYTGSGYGQEARGSDSAMATQSAAKSSVNQAYWGSFPNDFVDFPN